MIVLLNGPLGIGKSSLGEALSEALPDSLHLDGDALIATHPPVPEGPRGREQFHGAIELMVTHHVAYGIRNVVIGHVWFDPRDLADLVGRLQPAMPNGRTRCFRLRLDEEENLRRIERRARARALDEIDFERRTMHEERTRLCGRDDLGERFQVAAPLEQLVPALLQRLRCD